MRPMMSFQARRELLVAIRPRYRKAQRKDKTAMLDEFVAATGYDRKYAICLLGQRPRSSAENGLFRCCPTSSTPSNDIDRLSCGPKSDNACSASAPPPPIGSSRKQKRLSPTDAPSPSPEHSCASKSPSAPSPTGTKTVPASWRSTWWPTVERPDR